MVYFIGGYPCDSAGQELSAIRNSSNPQTLANVVEVNHTFSAKPKEPDKDHYEKMTRYIEFISPHANVLEPEASARTYKPVDSSQDEDLVFCYQDTNSCRAGTAALAKRLGQQRLAIVGLGGTGAYVLDFVAKTPVREIHLYDEDGFLSHNAFRTPGAPSVEELRAKPIKVHHLHTIYSQMHKGIIPHDAKVTEANITELLGLDFVFLCVDNGPSRKLIAEALRAGNIPFIDTGMGVDLVAGDKGLSGICRVTYFTPGKNDHLARLPMGAGQDDAYTSNIQVAELNALCASLAVIRWKKFQGFYVDLEHEHHSSYTIDTNKLINEELQA
ncbi:MAG: ThiF family adenylyltransferase [Desulfovibrionaceae bacterium]|nr:ThiF family adenylyltransferase [Desulfovibrionaceae bacterium]